MKSKDQVISDEKLDRLRAIFDPERRLETDDDLLDLAQYVEDESDADDTFIDNDFDFGSCN